MLINGWLLCFNDGRVVKLGSLEGTKLGRVETEGLELGLTDGAVLIEGRSVCSNDGSWDMVGWLEGFELGSLETVGSKLGK